MSYPFIKESLHISFTYVLIRYEFFFVFFGVLVYFNVLSICLSFSYYSCFPNQVILKIKKMVLTFLEHEYMNG